MRPVCRGARAGACRHRRQLLRAWRPLAVGDATDQPHPRDHGCRDRHPQLVRGADGGNSCPTDRRRGRRGARHCARPRVRPRYRCPSGSGGCGSSTGWKGRARPTRSRWRCASRARSIATRWSARWVTQSRATKACARSFPDTLGVPRQSILDAAAARPRLAVASVTEEGLTAALAATARQTFDIANEPPLRAHLFVLGEREHVLLLLLHHIAGDGWSMAPLVRDLAAAYAARCRGVAPELPALPVQYADYTLWHATVLGEESDPESVISRQLAYWTDRLEGLPDQLDLPFDRPRPAASSYRGDSVPVTLAPELHRRSAGVGARQRGQPVHGAAGGARRAADAAWSGHRHPDRQPDRRSHRQRARRPRRLLRQHAGAAYRHVGPAELPGAARAGPRPQSRRLRPTGSAVRAPGGGDQSGALAVASPAVPGGAGAAEQRAGRPRGIAGWIDGRAGVGRHRDRQG